MRCDDYLFAPKRACKYEPLAHEFLPALRELSEVLKARRARLDAINSLYGEWEIHV